MLWIDLRVKNNINVRFLLVGLNVPLVFKRQQNLIYPVKMVSF